MILKQGKKARIEKVASVNKLGQLNNINYFEVYFNDKKEGVYSSIIEANRKFYELELA